MKLVIFGLSISSSWGNGHATLWRGLCNAMTARGHAVHFFERDVPYYAQYRDYAEMPAGGRLHLYRDWESAVPIARRMLADADVSMVTSYCPDALAAAELAFESPVPIRTFYDLDTGVTLHKFAAGEPVDYIGPRLLSDYDLVLSYTGGKALTQLCTMLRARAVEPLYGSVDPQAHYTAEHNPRFAADLSYLGTYAEDRQAALQRLFLEPAQALAHRRFCLGGALYPAEFPWSGNIFFVRHLPPAEHSEFYSSSRWTLNVTRAAMAEMGYCPSARFFEAASCGTPVLTDWFDGLDSFFLPGSEVVVARSTGEAIAALQMTDAERNRMARLARERTLEEHTARARVIELERILENAASHAKNAAPAEVS